MPHRLQRPLARVIMINGMPARAVDTFLDAVACLSERPDARDEDGIDVIIDQLILAAQSENPGEIEEATELFAAAVQRWRK